jgi:hypothetical protein
MNDKHSALDVYLREFDTIKAEQAARIAFRDNLVYITLVSYGAIMAFAAKDNHLALLILPWVSLILGWGYLVNDEKVSAIGRYVRIALSAKIAPLLEVEHPDRLFEWEIVHRSDLRRRRRKLEQLVIDEIIFVFSGFAALVAFCILDTGSSWMLKAVVGIEAVLLVILGLEIIVYADLKSGR